MGSFIFPSTLTTTAISSGNTFGTLTILTAGIYCIEFNITFSTGGSTITRATGTLSGTGVPDGNAIFAGGPVNLTGSFAVLGSITVICTASNYTLSTAWSGGGATGTLVTASSYYQALRIA